MKSIAQAKFTRANISLIVQAVALFALTLFLLWVVPMWLQNWKSMDPLERIVPAGVLINYLVIVLAIPVYLRHRGRSRLLSVAMWIATVLVLLGLIGPFVIGGLQEAMFVRCAGFFGAQESCIQTWQLTAVILSTIYPFVLASWAVLAVLPFLTILGAWKAVRHPVT
jgi:hypothetical protein